MFEKIAAYLAKQMDISVDDIERDTTFESLGIDSLDIVEMIMDLESELGVELVLSGHCHGGVVRLPFVGGVFGTRRELFPDYDAGAYRQDGTVLYVSRGLGYTNVHFRLFNRPHVPILLLKSGKNVNKS